jgi:PPOX class probable F420-dependent enzyme
VSAAAPAWALAVLREARVGRLATADAAGRPLVVPVCFAFDGEAVYSAVDDKPKRTRELRRLRNVTENPHASIVVDEWNEDWSRLRWVIVEGTAEVMRGGTLFDRAIDALVAKYPQYGTMDLRTNGAVLRLRAERILAWRAAEG